MSPRREPDAHTGSSTTDEPAGILRPGRGFLEQSNDLAAAVLRSTAEGAAAPSPKHPAEGRRRAVKAPGSAMKASNIMIDVELDRRLALLKRQLKMSQGDLVIASVESEISTIRERPAKATSVGGSLFAPRQAATKGIETDRKERVYTFRLRAEDFDVLDALTEQYAFPSRKALIVACLDAFCDRNDITT